MVCRGNTWFTDFSGNDGVNKDGKRADSSYMEEDVPFKLSAIEWAATVSAVPWATASYDTTGY